MVAVVLNECLGCPFFGTRGAGVVEVSRISRTMILSFSLILRTASRDHRQTATIPLEGL
jgi:hypothetical protein